MFSIKNIYTKSSTVINIENLDSNVEFIISTIISKKNKDELDDPRQFTLLDGFINWKGDDFKKKLYDRYVRSFNDIIDTATLKEIYPLPVYIVNPILDMFRLDEVVKYLVEVYGLKAPSNLADEFDEMIELDGRGTRVQTYIKKDYIELAALVVVIKAIIGPIGQFAYVRSKDLNKTHKNYILYQFLIQHPIFQSEPAEKLWGLIDKVVNLPTNESVLDSIRTLENRLPKDEIPTAVLARVVIEKLPLACIVDDDKDKNIVTKIYNYVNNKLKSQGDTTKSIKPKTSLVDSESGTGDEESIIESTRVCGNLGTATPLEISWSINSIEAIMFQLPDYMKKDIDLALAYEAHDCCQVFMNGNLHRTQIDMLTFLFKDVVVPRALEHVDIESIINLMGVGFSYLWGMGFKQMALLLIAQQDTTQTDIMTINTTVNRSRLSKEMKDELERLYPYKRVINEDTQANLVEELITTLVNEIYDVRWIHTGKDKWVEEVLGDRNSDKILPVDLKLQLASIIIEHEKRRQ